MKTIGMVLVAGFAITMIVSGCKKKEDAPKAPAQAPTPPAMDATGVTVPKEMTVIVPDNVKAMWKKVKIGVEDKATKKTTEFVVNVGAELKVPGTNLTIVVIDFLPDFRMEGATITSPTTNPNNPAARVEILENGKSIFKGWLYSKFPAIHPFEHEKYGVVLKEGVQG